MNVVLRLSLLTLALIAGVTSAPAQMTVVNGASFDPSQPVAPGSFATVFGSNLCPGTDEGQWTAPGQLPQTLAGCSLTVNGVPAMLQYMSPGQANFIMPPGVPPGQAVIAVNNGTQTITGTLVAGASGPGTFAINGMGMGEGAMLNSSTWQMGPFSTTTGGQPTYVALYVTGLDLSSKPQVMVGGIPVDVLWSGLAPGYAGLQQINIMLPATMAGVGRVPVTVTSDGQTGNVTFLHVLPTTAMMQGMPGWGQGMMVGENMSRGHEMSYLAYNPASNSALVTDENDDVVRVISLASNATIATITLPGGSQAHALAVSPDGALAAAVLSGKAAVAIIDLNRNTVTSVVSTGYYPSRAAFSGSSTLLVTNAAGGVLSVIDTASGTVTGAIKAGFGASGIAVSGTTAVVAGMQAGSVSVVDLTGSSVKTVPLPAGTRPHEVAISGNTAVITTPMSNGFLLLDLATLTFKQVSTASWNGMGPGGVAVLGNNIYIANQMTASVTVADLSGNVARTFSVDPGPIALAAVPGKNQLLVLAEGAGTLDVIDLTSYSIVSRINAGDTERDGDFIMPLISSASPSSAAVGSTFTLTLSGSGFQDVQQLDFLTSGTGMGGGMMGGGGMAGGGMGQADANITVGNLQVNAAGTQLTASVQILPAAAPGARQIRLQTHGRFAMGMMTNAAFTVTR